MHVGGISAVYRLLWRVQNPSQPLEEVVRITLCGCKPGTVPSLKGSTYVVMWCWEIHRRGVSNMTKGTRSRISTSVWRSPFLYVYVRTPTRLIQCTLHRLSNMASTCDVFTQHNRYQCYNTVYVRMYVRATHAQVHIYETTSAMVEGEMEQRTKHKCMWGSFNITTRVE